MKYSGLGILDVLLILFVVLKLIKVINWPWLVVLIPLWMILGLTIILIIIYFINLIKIYNNYLKDDK